MTIVWAALPTAPIVRPQNRNAAMPPMKAPTSTLGFMRLTWKKSMKSIMLAVDGLNMLPALSMKVWP